MMSAAISASAWTIFKVVLPWTMFCWTLYGLRWLMCAVGRWFFWRLL